MQAMDFESKSADATGSVRPSMRILVIEDDKEAANWLIKGLSEGAVKG